METKVSIDIHGLEALHKMAIANGTLTAWSSLALDWMKAANDEMARLKKELEKSNIDHSEIPALPNHVVERINQTRKDWDEKKIIIPQILSIEEVTVLVSSIPNMHDLVQLAAKAGREKK